MSKARLVGLVVDLVIRVGLIAGFFVAWINDNYPEAFMAVLWLIVFQLHDIWMEVKK